MSDPQLPPVPPTPPNGNATNPPQQPQFPSAPPAASALPANPQYPAAPPYGTPQQTAPQPPYGQQAPQQQAPQQQAYGQPQAQPYGQAAPQGAYAHPGAAPYAATQQPAYGATPAPARPAGSTNTLARVAFIIALAVAAIGALQVLIQPFLLSSIGYYGGYGAVTLLFGIFSFLASGAALVLGLIAVRRPGGQVFAGIAIGIGGVQLLGVILGWIASLFYGFL